MAEEEEEDYSSISSVEEEEDYFEHVKNGGDSVSLAEKSIGDEGAKQIAKALMDPTTKVRSLDLTNNNIQLSGALAIAKALKTN